MKKEKFNIILDNSKNVVADELLFDLLFSPCYYIQQSKRGLKHMKKYTQFYNIELNDTGLIDGNPRRMVAYKRLKEQGINNLTELFNRYDNDAIDYGINTENMGCFEASETKGVVELLRYKYLNQSLNINPLTNLSQMTNGKNRNEVMHYLQSIGLPQRACLVSYFWIDKQYGKTITLIDLLKELKINNIYEGNYPKCFQTTLNEKIKLLLEYSEKLLANNSAENYQNIDSINRWYEIMNPIDVQTYRNYKREEVEQTFKNVNWLKYNDAMLLDDDEEFYTYIKLKNKIRNNYRG